MDNKKNKAKKTKRTVVDWKQAEKRHMKQLQDDGGFTLMAFHARNKVPERVDALLYMYFREFCGGGTPSIEATIKFLQSIPDAFPLRVSQETFLYILKRSLEMCFVHDRQVETDPLLLNLLATKLHVHDHRKHEYCQMWLQFLCDAMTRLLKGRTDLLFYYQQWRSSTVKVFTLPLPEAHVSPEPKRINHPRACDWFLQTPIPLLEKWLQTMESSQAYYKLQMPTCEDLLQRVGCAASHVRQRLIERAYKVSCSAVYLCWYDYGVPISPMISWICREAPVLYYTEPAGYSTRLLQHVDVIPQSTREVFLMRSPKILRLNAASIVIKDLYASERLFASCIDGWNQHLSPYLSKDLICHLVIPYMMPVLIMQQQLPN